MTFDPTISAAALLAIPETEPERVFTGATKIRHEHAELVRIWHPDQNGSPEAAKVFRHIERLYHAAMAKFRNDSWGPMNGANS